MLRSRLLRCYSCLRFREPLPVQFCFLLRVPESSLLRIARALDMEHRNDHGAHVSSIVEPAILTAEQTVSLKLPQAMLGRVIPTPIQCFPLSNPRGNHGKPKQRASGASCGAQANAVTGREVGSSDFSNRIVERFGNNPSGTSTDASNIGGLTTQNGASTEGKMGKGSCDSANSDSKDHVLGSSEAHHVSGSPHEDCGISTGKVGESEGSAEEGCIAACPCSRANTRSFISLGGLALRIFGAAPELSPPSINQTHC